MCAVCHRPAQVSLADSQQGVPATIRCCCCGFLRKLFKEVVPALHETGQERILSQVNERLDKIAAKDGPKPGSQLFRDAFDGIPVFVWFNRERARAFHMARFGEQD